MSVITLSNVYLTYCQTVMCTTQITAWQHNYFCGNAWSTPSVLATLCRDGAGPRRWRVLPSIVARRIVLTVTDSLPRAAAVRMLGVPPGVLGRRKDRIVTAPETAGLQAPG